MMSGTMPSSVLVNAQFEFLRLILMDSHMVQGEFFLVHKRPPTPFSLSKLEPLILIGHSIATRVGYYAILLDPTNSAYCAILSCTSNWLNHIQDCEIQKNLTPQSCALPFPLFHSPLCCVSNLLE